MDLIRKLVSIPSFTGNFYAIDKCIELCMNIVDKNAYFFEKNKNGYKSLLISTHNSLDFDVLSLCHIDVYRSDKYEMIETIDKIYGRGVFDMKSFVVSNLVNFNNIINTNKSLKYGILISTIVGSMIVIYDYFPSRLDNMNDGYRLVLLNKKINIDAFNELLRIQRNEFFNEPNNNIRQFKQITDFTAQVNMMGAEQAIDNNYEYSLEIIDNILSQKDKISKNTLFDIKLTKCFILLLYKDVEEGKTFYLNEFNDEERRRISSCNRIDTIKVYLLYAGLVEKSDSEVEYALEKSIKALRKALPGVKDKEKKLLDLAINKVKVKKENV